MDFSTIPDAVMLARGQYSTCRAAHEDEKKRLQILCGALSAHSAQVLRAMQPDNDGSPDMENVAGLLARARTLIAEMDECATTIQSLAEQRAALRPIAWPKGI